MAPARILTVEDSHIVSMHIRAVLEIAGFTVLESVTTGEAAIEAALVHSPDLILMDIMLAGKMTGIEASEEIMQHQKIPIIFLTALTDKKTLELANATALYGYITKPFDELDLVAIVDLALSKAKSE
jgi:CheY-like chemotaxis protein